MSKNNLTAHLSYGEGYAIGMAGGELVPKQCDEYQKGFVAGQEARDMFIGAGCSVSVSIEVEN